MFLDFYQLREQPFGVTPDPRFLYLGQSHREALASLFCGIEADRGFLSLISPPGLGKTTLTFQLLERLPKARTVFLFQTQCNSRELFQYLLSALGVDTASMGIVAMHNRLNEILSQEMQAGRRFVLAVDEAQNLDSDVLETIRLLSNFETSRSKLIQIVLIGQPQLSRKLAHPALVQLQQRISVFARLEPFGFEDTTHYIDHRLRIAGFKGSMLFTSSATKIIAERSQGIPREINRLCFSALSLGFAMGRSRVDADTMGEVVADLNLEPLNEPIRSSATHVQPPTTPVLSYRGAPRKWLGRQTIKLFGGGMSVGVLIVILGLFSGKVGWFLQATAGSSRSLPNSLVSAENSSKTTAVPEQPSNAPRDMKVKVQPGDTLFRIVSRALGQDYRGMLTPIQKLNPSLTNLDHIEVGQEIRLPRSNSVDTLPGSGSNDLIDPK